tara:strand:+ start:122488 stop:123696 length:1209 start_codon:yes stop_codon:yes gene_type:complete
MNLKNHTKLAMLYFTFAAALGCVLRFFKVVDIPVTYKFIIHAHSHVALLGWVYLGLTTLLYKLYLRNPEIETKYRSIFWFSQVTIIGMLLTFPFQGYALFSIVFSTLFLFASYWFSWFFFKNVPAKYNKKQSVKCAKVALVYFLISSIGPWALGGIMNTLGATSIWYRLAIYFYLHFIYNGFMIMALVAIFFYILEKQGIFMPERSFNKFFWKLNIGIVLSLLLSTLFIRPNVFYYILGGIGALAQLWALFDLVKFLKEERNAVKKLFSPFYVHFLKIIGLLWAMKMFLQLLSAVPYFADIAVTYLDFTIGYLHLTFLGVVTISLFMFLDYFQLLFVDKKLFSLYVFGFALTEVLIFYKGIISWQSTSLFASYNLVLAVASLLILLVVLSILLGRNSGRIKD